MRKAIHTVVTVAIILTVGILVSTQAYAQAAHKKMMGKEWIQKQVDDLTAAIPDLTEEQKTKLLDVLAARGEGLREVKALREGGASEDEIKAKSKELWTAQKAALEGILTPEQHAKYDEYMKSKSSKKEE